MNNFTGLFMTGGIYLAILVVYTLPIWFLWIWIRDDLQSAVNAVFSVSKLICAGVAWLGGLFVVTAFMLIPLITLAFGGWQDMDTTLKVTGGVVKIALVVGACGLYSYRLWNYEIVEWKFEKVTSKPTSIYSLPKSTLSEEISERVPQEKHEKERAGEEIHRTLVFVLVGCVLCFLDGYLRVLGAFFVVTGIMHIIMVKVFKIF